MLTRNWALRIKIRSIMGMDMGCEQKLALLT